MGWSSVQAHGTAVPLFERVCSIYMPAVISGATVVAYYLVLRSSIVRTYD